MTFQKPKGTQDFYPEDKALQNKIFNILRSVAQKYNFQEIESPAFENIEVLTKKEGEEITSQIFTLEKRGEEKFGLRFDLTVPAARMFIAKQKEIPKPVKWFYLSRMWRYEQPQTGRLREFYQLSAEIFGSDRPEADAEAISLLIDCFLALGLTSNDFLVKINNRKLLQGIVAELVPQGNINKVITLIDKKDKISEQDFIASLKDQGVDEAKAAQLMKMLNITDLAKLKDLNKEAEEGKKELQAILELLKARKEFIQVNLSTARGLAYYTGTVFEVADRQGKFRALAGGGRYDQMIESFGGDPCPATGFGLGYATLLLILQEKKLMPAVDARPDFYIAAVTENEQEKALEIASQLRKKYVVEIDLMGKKIGKQLKYANQISAKKAIIIGEKEAKERKAKIKDMDSGEEKEVSFEELSMI